MAGLGHAIHVFIYVREDVDAGPAPGMTMYQGHDDGHVPCLNVIRLFRGTS
jgi:hypothetical protein